MANFSTITIKREKTTVIFSGSVYYFHSNYFGLLAVAARDFEDENMFHISVGNHYTIGGSVTADSVFEAVKKYVKKSENIHILKTITFNRKDTDLANYNLSINLLKNQ